jgi:hypothetical protein
MVVASISRVHSELADGFAEHAAGADAEHAAGADGHGASEGAGGVGCVDGGVGQDHVGEAAPRRPCNATQG